MLAAAVSGRARARRPTPHAGKPSGAEKPSVSSGTGERTRAQSTSGPVLHVTFVDLAGEGGRSQAEIKPAATTVPVETSIPNQQNKNRPNRQVQLKFGSARRAYVIVGAGRAKGAKYWCR